MTPQISRLFFYPIKSFRGIETNSLQLEKQGAKWDRQWMLIDEQNKFLTQRQLPRLAKIGVAFIDESRIELSTGGELFADFGLLEQEGGPLQVKIWKDEVEAYEVSSEVSEDISKAIDKPVKLVRLSEKSDRPGRFSDDEPIQVLSEESNKALEEKAKVSLSIVRFRPNIVVKNCFPHAEDGWKGFKVGDLSFTASKPCTRCKITTVHPLTGEVGDEPLKTLMTYRKGEKGIAFGHYFVNDLNGEIRVGQTLTTF